MTASAHPPANRTYTLPIRSLLISTLVLAPAIFFANAAGAQNAPQSDDERAFYSIGTVYARNLESLKPVSARELEMLTLGLRDALEGNTLAVDQQQGATLTRALVTERQARAVKLEKTTSAAYAAAEAKKPGAQTTESGLIYTEIRAGNGASPGATDKVKVHYHGTLRDGTVFDSSVDRNEPAEFPLNRVIACWTEGVAMMNVGGKSRLVCPEDIAYGDRGPASIPGGATLTFEVELLEILP